MIVGDLEERVNIDLQKTAMELRRKIRNAVQDTANDIVEDVAGKGPHAAPYKTGNLRASYYAEMISDYEGRVANNVETAPYAIYVELGTRKMAARPHLKPAAEYHGPKLVERVREALDVK